MKARAAHWLGASLGLFVATGYFAWKRFSPPPCSGAVFVELRPPLLEPGPYHFRLNLDDERQCEFTVPLPARAAVDTKRCGMALALETRIQGARSSIVGLTIGAAPEQLHLQVRRAGELLYDSRLELRYGPYATRREDSQRFCGDRAFVQPECVRGSSQCAPYPPLCTGPASCGGSHEVCCVTPDQAREYGVHAGTECSSRRACADRFGAVACRIDADCADGEHCTDDSFARYYKQPIRVCAAGKALAGSVKKK